MVYEVVLYRFHSIFESVPRKKLYRRVKALRNPEKYRLFLGKAMADSVDNDNDTDDGIERMEMTYDEAVEFCESNTFVAVKQITTDRKELVSCDAQLCEIKYLGNL